MMDYAKDGQHDKMHWGCCWMPVLGKLLWVLAFLDMVGGGAALWMGGELFGVGYMTWLWFALLKGVLAIGAKSSSHHWHMMKMMNKE